MMKTNSLSFVVLSADIDSLNEIRAALTADGRTKMLSGGNDAEQLHDEVVRLKPSAAIICLAADPEQAIELIRRLKAECPSTALISAAQETSSDLILRSLRAGAQEFLRLPIRSDELGVVLDRIDEFCAEHAPEEKKLGRMTAVFSSKGGCGTSFIATNLAVSLPGRTALVDLNFETGDLPLFLGLQPKYSVADLLARHGRLDDRLVSAFVTNYSKELHLLAAPREIDPIEKIEPEHVFEVLQRLRQCYDRIVIDPQHTFDAITLLALDQADEIVLVLTLDLPAVRSAQRALQAFERAGFPRSKVRILVNRWSRQIDLDLGQVEEILGGPVVGSLASDYRTVVTSINLGTPLVESDPRSKIAREIRRVAGVLSGEPIPKKTPKPKRPWSLFLKHQPAAGEG